MTKESWEKIENIMSMWGNEMESDGNLKAALEAVYDLGYSNAEDDIKRR